MDGLDWTNCRTRPGLVYGTETGTNSNRYDDSTCILTGTWGPLQTVEATVFTHNQSDEYFQEVELRLDSTITAYRSTGYEVLFRVRHPGEYASIVRRNGSLGKFTYLNQKTNTSYQGIQTGDTVEASIGASGVIVGYVNCVEVIRAIDTTYPGGNPGIGFWLYARSGLLRGGQGRGTNADFGFSTFSATDGRIGVMNPGGRRANRTTLATGNLVGYKISTADRHFSMVLQAPHTDSMSEAGSARRWCTRGCELLLSAYLLPHLVVMRHKPLGIK